MLWIPLSILVVATVTDLRRREIPDWIPMALLAWAIAATALGLGSHGWTSLALGLAAGLAFGVFVFWLGGFGGGDAKLLAALGATLGAPEFFTFMFYAAIAGGLVAVLALLRGKRDLAYAPVMAVGFAGFMMFQ
jgi:Flp pilus assembly protein protease CpaA